MNRNPQTQNSNRDMALCVFCGQDGTAGRLVPYDLRLPLIYGRAWQLSAACWDTAACHARPSARDCHMDERWSVTDAGRAALAAAEAPEVA